MQSFAKTENFTYKIRLGVAIFAYWTLGSFTALIPLALIAAYLDLPNRSSWGWGLVVLPSFVGVGVILRCWTRIKAEAAQWTPGKDVSDAAKQFAIDSVKLVTTLALGLPVLGAALLLCCGLLWGGYTLFAVLPVSGAIIIGALLIALAILAVSKVSN